MQEVSSTQRTRVNVCISLYPCSCVPWQSSSLRHCCHIHRGQVPTVNFLLRTIFRMAARAQRCHLARTWIGDGRRGSHFTSGRVRDVSACMSVKNIWLVIMRNSAQSCSIKWFDCYKFTRYSYHPYYISQRLGTTLCCISQSPLESTIDHINGRPGDIDHIREISQAIDHIRLLRERPLAIDHI